MYEMKIRFRDTITQLRVGQRLELECQTDRDYGVSWVRQDKNGTLHFIVFISFLSRVTFMGNQGTPTRFEASKDNTIYRLVVKSFTQQDEGNYFCLANINRRLYFSPGLPAFFPVITTPGPTTQRGITGKDSNVKTQDPGSLGAGRERGTAGFWPTDTTETCRHFGPRAPAGPFPFSIHAQRLDSMILEVIYKLNVSVLFWPLPFSFPSESSTEKDLNSFCDGVIWVPLAGACLLLLIALAITILQCPKTRRRRCRCKRPVQGKPHTKPGTKN
ncbi:T-cell surface glycoprotein CD8 alpha chain-like [Pseudopipra pipra]|uniref:T-cell surface glycoprotein CD8 alpha chain-like n=1 Tax=Pseudopipra pipra TaxID=415032 RepID=UPI00313998CF